MTNLNTGSVDDRHQILALSGGGFRGLFTVSFLAKCEAEYGQAWTERFALIAGTSVGALLASAIASGVSARELHEAMPKLGRAIFARRLMQGPRRLIGSAPYATRSLSASVVEVLGRERADTKLFAIDEPLLIPAVSYSTGEAVLFRSRGVSKEGGSDVTLLQAILASSAAPTYFPMVGIERAEFIDGGLVANAPDIIALHDAVALQLARRDRCYMLSVGTAGWRASEALRDRPRNPGVISWISRRNLTQTIITAQENLAVRQARQVLRDRHVRIDREPDARQVAAVKSLDNCSQKAIDALEALARAAWEEHGRSRYVRDFFAR